MSEIGQVHKNAWFDYRKTPEKKSETEQMRKFSNEKPHMLIAYL